MASVYTSPPYVSLHERLNEQLLIVDVFGKILNCLQNKETYSDFIGRMGFLSWLRCVLCRDATWFPQSYAALLHLFSLTLHKSHDLDLGDFNDISFMALGMAPKIMESTLALALASDNAALKAKKSVLIACSEGLVAIGQTMQDSYKHMVHSFEGFAVRTVTQFIERLVELEVADKFVLAAVCDLPFQINLNIEPDGDNGDLLKFCARLLLVTCSTSNAKEPSDAVYYAVMTRVCVLLGLVNRPHDPEILLALISCRKQCSREEGTRKKWFECFSMVSSFLSLGSVQSHAH